MRSADAQVSTQAKAFGEHERRGSQKGAIRRGSADRIALSSRFEKLAFRNRAAVKNPLVVERSSESLARDPRDDRARDRIRPSIAERIGYALRPNQNVTLGVEQHR